MWPSWGCEDRLEVMPDRLVLRRGRPRPGLPVASAVARDVRDAGEMESGLRVLTADPGAAFRGCGRAVAVLSNRFVHYLLVPRQILLNSETQYEAYARAGFARIYGEAVSAWEVRVSLDSVRGPYLAAAVDQAVVVSIQQGAASSGFKLGPVRPLFAEVVRRWRDRAAVHTGGIETWWVVAERGQLCVGLQQGGRWRGIQNLRCVDAASELAGVVARMSGPLGVDPAAGQFLVYMRDCDLSSAFAAYPHVTVLAGFGAQAPVMVQE